MCSKELLLMSPHEYVHGYSDRENIRLMDQANTLTELLHSDTVYPPGSRVLEAGCGVGAQTVILTRNSPQAEFVAIDISPDSLQQAQKRVRAQARTNVTFEQADLFNLPFNAESFDHVFVCFVLEHLSQPAEALACLKKVLKPGGTLTAIEGDHGSTYFHPDSDEAQQAIQCLVDLQAEIGGDALIGRRLYPLMQKAGYREVTASPRMVYVDASRPQLVEGFTRNTFTAMVKGVRNAALQSGRIDAVTWERGIAALERTSEADGTFCYTFFKGLGKK